MEERTAIISGAKSLQLGIDPCLPLSEEELRILIQQLRGSSSIKEIYYTWDIYEPSDAFKPWVVDRYVCPPLHVCMTY